MRTIAYILILFFILWFGGYVWYLSGLADNRAENQERTDAIVVLTGGPNRLDVAISLLEKEYAQKLYISGVDQKVTRGELLTLLATSPALEECCIESGSQATDTVGNAIETLKWAEQNNIKSIRVVTALEHMPRAMVEFRRFMPDLILIEHPVGNWNSDSVNYFSLSQEYSKYIVSLLRAKASGQFYGNISES